MADRIVTIYDIAKEAGVSPATVSRVLTKSARVSPAKKQAVQALIEKYNFQPNALAKSLSDTQTRVIGLMVADIRNPFYSELSVACENAASRRGYTVLLCNAFNDEMLEESHLDKFTAQRVDAIIQIGCRVDDLVSDPAYVERVNRIAQTIPFISTGKLENGNIYSLGIDHAEAIRLAFEHLLALNHRRIALLGGALTVRSTYEKWMQYIYLLGANGLPVRKEYVQEGSYSFQSGIECMNRLLKLDEPPTAIIAINDYTATGVVAALNAAGYSVPRDFSVISHDNTHLSEMITPRLTSIDYGYSEMGEGLVDIALRLVNGKDVQREKLIMPTLVQRDSCAILSQ